MLYIFLSDVEAKNKYEKTVAVQTREENVSNSDNLPIIGLKKKTVQGSSETASPTPTSEFVLFPFQFIHLADAHITHKIFHCYSHVYLLNLILS